MGEGNPEWSEKNGDLAERWKVQALLERAAEALANGRDQEAMGLASRFALRRTIFAGLLARMMQTGRTGLVRYAVEAVERDRVLAEARFHGRTLLHYAAGAGCIEMAGVLLRLGVDPNIEDHGGHTALYRVANECGTAAGPELVRMLVGAGADINACGGVTRATPIHMSARRGFVVVARALIACGAAVDAVDSKGVTPLERARQCRRGGIVELLSGFF